MTTQRLELKDIENIAKTIIDLDKNIIFLHGKIGSGKTTLVQSIAKLLNVKDNVTSPTFSLLNVYDDKIYHYDMYNKNFEELYSLGLLESFENEGLHLVEWGDERLKRALERLGYDTIALYIEGEGNYREYRIEDA